MVKFFVKIHDIPDVSKPSIVKINIPKIMKSKISGMAENPTVFTLKLVIQDPIKMVIKIPTQKPVCSFCLIFIVYSYVVL
ncbi:MAG: hypothetical protein O9302_04750 [Cyclobacteriaceae bacterium]|jgi:hypothetical protein|nr:hypothetical protein [Flammeovirgaceae bacterium]MCZ8022968.1 hypothetical protein [Cytophagales bacterium]MCZ8327344.1 hypothetical protein [Cyclobacteriaceae bacterium]